MSITVRVDRETERLLARLVRSKRRTKSDVIREAIRSYAAKEAPESSAYEQLSDFIGVIDSGGKNLSEDTHEKYARKVKERHARSHR